jgi:hypothetical protein
VRAAGQTGGVQESRSRDDNTIYIVRVLLLSAMLGLIPVSVIAGLAKLTASSFDAGRLALDIGWPVGFIVAAAVVLIRRGRRGV